VGKGPVIRSRKEKTRLCGVDYNVLFLLLVPFVKGDSYPELCAQRTDEGDGTRNGGMRL
jgi:hypothetical protein